MEQSCTPTTLEWFKLGADLIKGLAWPIAIFSVVMLFRQQIRERIKDVISIGPTGAVLQAVLPAPSFEIGGIETAPHPMHLVNELEVSIRKDLKDMQESVRVPRLVRALAEARAEGVFEAIYGIIFRSQILALEQLYMKPLSLEDAKELYETHVKPLNTDVYSKWSFEEWSSFLLKQNLVIFHDGQFSITDGGKDFLVFVRAKKNIATKPAM